MKHYTGIGSRETPKDILELMTQLAVQLEKKGYTLRSGGAGGADSAFEQGASTAKEIFLPWRGFNGNTSKLYRIDRKALDLAESLHPAWHRCSPGARKLHARNTYQVLGTDLETPSEMLICWTSNGKRVGGTATAIKLAESHGVEVINLGNNEGLAKAKAYLNRNP